VVAGLPLTMRGMPWFQLDLLWPALVALVGVGLLVAGYRR